MAETEQSLPGWQRFVPHWARSTHPVYRREIERWQRTRRIQPYRTGCAPLALVAFVGLGFLCGLTTIEPDTAPVDRLLIWSWILLSALLVGQAFVMFATGLMSTALSATLISGELESETFGLLRVTGVPTSEIILAKYAAALRQLVAPLVVIVSTRVLFILGAAVVVDFTLRTQGLGGGLTGLLLEIPVEWISPLSVGTFAAASLAWLGYFVFKPILSLMLFSSVGLFASSTARTRVNGVITSILLRVALFVLRFIADQSVTVGGQFSIAYGINGSSPGTMVETLILNRPALAIAIGSLIALSGMIIPILWRAGLTFLLVRGTVRRAHKLPYE